MVELCEDTRPTTQFNKAQEQHKALISNLRGQGCNSVTLLAILIGVMGTIYKDFTDEPLKKLGLEYNHAIKLTHKLNEHSVQYATKLINARHALHKNISDNKGTGDGASTQSS